MSFPTVEFTDSKGDQWTIRACDDNDDCAVIEKQMAAPANVEEIEPEDLHIPIESLHKLSMAAEAIHKTFESVKFIRGKLRL